jgi:methyl-accepting chemotaxis protein
MLKDASLKKRLLFASGASSFVLFLVGLIGYYSLYKVNRTYSEVAEVNLPNIESLTAVESTIQKIQLSVVAIKGEHLTAEHLEKMTKENAESLALVAKAAHDYDTLPFAPGEAPLWDKTQVAYKLVLSLSEEAMKLSRTGKPEDEHKRDRLLEEPFFQADTAFQAAIDANEDFISKLASDQSKSANETAKFAFWCVIIGVFGGMGLSLFIGYNLARSLSNALGDATDRLAKGAHEVAGASTQIAEAGTELSSSATEQAAALQQTVASLEEVSAMVNKSADNAQRSLQTSSQSQETANRGKHAVNEMIHAIEDISRSNADIVQQIETSNREISDIVKVISEIGNKTKVINDIVFQTKLLSFNASVEAARAGEHGKGFAVVAEEVGNLAQMSGNAAKEISGMLDESILKVEKIVNDTKSKVENLVSIGRQKVEMGASTAKQCGSVLEELVGSVGQVNQMVGEIATACQEQAQGVQEINKAMGQLDQVTQQNAAASQQAASSAEQLQAQTAELRSVVNSLTYTVMGAEGGHQAPSSTGFTQPSRKTVKNVISLERKAQEKRNASRPVAMKRASGSDVMPSDDDPRFEDI